ncbi:hypothetical protein GOP47_0002892 [Adiantum capillus-veneris]|uniref:Uncharacterized protein n=1 Tax=Adiantum capillus-veneris TaxID=13818 RepID=A0A9D4VBQ8_ADICA|nr:hypothetical protein GOP47_0002892 [Adiantum capillus-veneris]
MAFLAVAALLLLLLLTFLRKSLSLFVWEPLRIQRCLRAQGVSGPSYRVLVGNFPEISATTKAIRASPLPHVTHNIMPRVLPDFSIWSEKYGDRAMDDILQFLMSLHYGRLFPRSVEYCLKLSKQYLYWLGWKARLAVVDPELCKEVLFNKFGHYAKPNVPAQLLDILVNGLITLEGEKWTQHKRVVHPAFFLNNLKGMVPTIVDLTSAMLEKWKSESLCKEVDAFKEFHALAADVIAHTVFGSSYAEWKQVFLLQYQQLALMSAFIFCYYPWNQATLLCIMSPSFLKPAAPGKAVRRIQS